MRIPVVRGGHIVHRFWVESSILGREASRDNRGDFPLRGSLV